jgi:hypothetical protein
VVVVVVQDLEMVLVVDQVVVDLPLDRLRLGELEVVIHIQEQ